MEDTSACILRLKEIDLSESSERMHGSSDSEYLSALSASTGGGTDTGEGSAVFHSSVEEQIEQSKVHWSLRAESDASEEGEEKAEVSNVQVFKDLQAKWDDHFFYIFNQGGGKSTLKVGKKFAEGGQAKLYEAHVKWGNPKKNEDDRKDGREWVLKVFRKGTLLSQLQSQWPQGFLKFRAEERQNWKSLTPRRFPRFYCTVYRGTLLEDGRFAFLMRKEHFDLRNLIERKMKLGSRENSGPFSKEDAELIMYYVALGMDWLHSRDIVHRDLKASNVLVKEFRSRSQKWQFVIADYECSIGVVGTGFFRAPEVLQAMKEGKLSQKPEVFSKAGDVYGFGMTCYEILTGKLPFDDHPKNDFNLVLSGKRPKVPKYVPVWTCELLSRCWDSNRTARPAFGEILSLLLSNSAEARKCEDSLKKEFGENFMSLHLTDIPNS